MLSKALLNLSFLFIYMYMPISIDTAVAAEQKLDLLVHGLSNPQILMGTWEHNILDSGQRVRYQVNEAGGGVKIIFDVDSSRPAMGGYWLKINEYDLSGYETLHLMLRAVSTPPFNGNVALQFTDENNRRSPYILSGVRNEWKEFEVPLRKFSRISDWSCVKKFEIVIDDIQARPKEGILFIGEMFLKGAGG